MQVIRSRSVAAVSADPTKFTGPVWRSDFLDAPDDHSLAGLCLSYAPGARSYWHVHEHEQVIVALYGSGVVSWDGLDVPELLTPGDWWHVTPGVPHWHGAAVDAPFAHLAVTAGGATTWLHEVDHADYAKTPNR